VPSPVDIGRHRIGRGYPCFVIAEVGVNHNGDLRLAHRLIESAVAAGADAVKFQTFTPELLSSADAPQADYQRVGESTGSQIEMLARLALSEPDYAELKAHADAAGITFLSSVFDERSVELLERLGVAAIKVPSGELTNHRLLRQIAHTGKPILMSTGMATLEEVDGAMARLGGAQSRLALLHCVSSYPADPRECNLRAIGLMRSRYGRPVGWSDHTEGIAVAGAAVALGAVVIEKHITLRRDLPGPDHAASVEPDEFRAMVASVRTIEMALGRPEKRPSEAELAIARVTRKSLHWARSLAANERIRTEDLRALRPGTGISPTQIDALAGRRVRTATVAGQLVHLDEIERDAAEDDG
jgi:N,N'-diacetyllegionaminate synthase